MDVKASIFDIQRFCIHDGPGIRTVVFFKGCNLRCPWCQNPESISPQPELAFYQERCIHCSDCFDVCPEQAIVLDKPPRIIRSSCNMCVQCVSVCPSKALQVIGQSYHADDLLEIVLQDKAYYDASDGGITVSGGEPSFQHVFLFEFLSSCRSHAIHTAMETNGLFQLDQLEKHLPLLDLIYFDLKIMNPDVFQKITGRSNKPILKNASHLARHASGFVEFRLLLVPGFTDTEDNLADVTAFLDSNNISCLHLVPYHKLGEAKLDRIQSPLKPLNLGNYTKEQLNKVRVYFEKRSISVKAS